MIGNNKLKSCNCACLWNVYGASAGCLTCDSHWCSVQWHAACPCRDPPAQTAVNWLSALASLGFPLATGLHHWAGRLPGNTLQHWHTRAWLWSCNEPGWRLQTTEQMEERDQSLGQYDVSLNSFAARTKNFVGTYLVCLGTVLVLSGLITLRCVLEVYFSSVPLYN